tara:strand:+ start:4254 stop:5042 length:789 start_codon:yes stop_codon:yes gene_type:complete
MKIAHECPLSIFDEVQAVTDYDYALVHLFEENVEYLDKFIKAKEMGREIILDNSIFELGEAFDGAKFAEWVVRLEPDWYIIPDVLDNCAATLNSFNSFVSAYPDLPGKSIAVAQGSSYDELVTCYIALANSPLVDKIAMSFNHPFFQEYSGQTKYHKMAAGRQSVLTKMLGEGVINTSKPHHLLGCGLPQEFRVYNEFGWKWIDSVDTSNPVIHGMHNIRYKDWGLDNKESVKLYTLLEANVVDKLDDILYNIDIFRQFCKG